MLARISANPLECAIECMFPKPRAHVRLMPGAFPERPRASADGEDARAPCAARRFDRDLVAHLAAHQRLAEWRIRRHAADARDLDLHLLALFVLDLDVRSD